MGLFKKKTKDLSLADISKRVCKLEQKVDGMECKLDGVLKETKKILKNKEDGNHENKG